LGSSISTQSTHPELVEEEEEEEEDKDNFELELEETEAVHEAKRQRCKYHSEARLILRHW